MRQSSDRAAIMSVSRTRFLLGAGATATVAMGGTRPASADGARSGPWCKALSKAGRENAFDFRLHQLDSDAVFRLSELTGAPVWINFFATWCGPCNREMGDIVRIGSKYGDAFHMVGVDVKEQPDSVRAFRDLHKVTFPIALDTDGHLFKALGFTGLPTHVFVDATGHISCISVGDLTPDEMDNELAVAIARTTAR